LRRLAGTSAGTEQLCNDLMHKFLVGVRFSKSPHILEVSRAKPRHSRKAECCLAGPHFGLCSWAFGTQRGQVRFCSGLGGTASGDQGMASLILSPDGLLYQRALGIVRRETSDFGSLTPPKLLQLLAR